MMYFLMFLLGFITCYLVLAGLSVQKQSRAQTRFAKYAYGIRAKWLRFKYRMKL